MAIEPARTRSLQAQAREQARARVVHLGWQQIAVQVEALMFQALDSSTSADRVARLAGVA